MTNFVLTGNDTSVINNRVLADLAGAEPIVVSFENDLAVGETGKNGNSIIAPNRMGNMATVAISVLIGSSDDKFFGSQLASYRRDSASYPLMTGKFTKRTGDGEGNIAKKVVNLKGGFISKKPDYKENVQGDVAQGVVVYNIKFVDSEINDI